MKIKIEVLRQFLREISLAGALQLKEAILDFTETGIYLTSKVKEGSLVLEGTLNREAIEDYEVLGKVGIDDVSLLIKYIVKFDKFVEFCIKDNKIIFSEGRKRVSLFLRDIEYVEEPVEYPSDIVPDIKIDSLGKEELAEFIGLAKLGSSRTVTLHLANKELTLTGVKFDEVQQSIPVDVTDKFEASYDAELVQCLSIFASSIILNLNKDRSTLEVLSQTEDMTVRMLMYPLSEE